MEWVDYKTARQTFDLFLREEPIGAGDNNDNVFEPSISGSWMDCCANNMLTFSVSFSTDLHDSLIVHENAAKHWYVPSKNISRQEENYSNNTTLELE